MRTVLASGLLALPLLVAPAAAQLHAGHPQGAPQHEYVVSELPDLGNAFHIVHVFDVNDQGEAVGYILDDQLRWRAVRWDALGGVHDLGGASGTWSMARGISESGVISGFHGPTLQTARPVLWVNGNIVPLGDPPSGIGVEAWDANDAQVAVGRGHNGTDSFAMCWSAGTGSAIAGPTSYAFAVNERGVAAGFVTVSGFEFAARWDGAALTVLPDLGQGSGKAVGVNGAGTLVGSATSPIDGLAHGVAWHGTMIVDLGAYQGTFLTAATGINDRGLIVGDFYLDPVAEITRAMLWTPSGQAFNLNDLIPPGTGWTLTNATEVNDAGWIVGFGTRNGMGGIRGYVAKPR